MRIIHFGNTMLKKEKEYRWLFFSPSLPERLNWKKNQRLIISVNQNRDLLVQPLKGKTLKNLVQKSNTYWKIIQLRSPDRYWPKCYIPIPQELAEIAGHRKREILALTGINQNQLLIMKLILEIDP